MRDDSHELTTTAELDVSRFERVVDAARRVDPELIAESPWSYPVRRGLKPITIGELEFRILQFLAAKPYHAFTSEQIATAVSTEDTPVTAKSLRRHILSLRRQLGFFADYVQTVPFVGYRFKA